MVEALLSPEGAQCVSLGTQTPFDDIRHAAVAYKTQVVAVSFSSAFPLRQVGDAIGTLRRGLPAAVALWVGGEVTRRLRKTPAGVRMIPEIADALPALQAWRAESLAAR